MSTAKKLADEAGFVDTAFFPIDEPHSDELIAKSMKACGWIKEVGGARTYITSNPKAVARLEPVLDDVAYNLAYLNPTVIDRVQKVHETLMYYCPCFSDSPEDNRFRPGFYFLRSGTQSVQFFAYFECMMDPFNDLDGGNRDWTSCFPSMSSPYHDTTLEWESFREGVNDYQYAYTLQAMADRARKAGHADAADKAMKVLDAVLSAVDIDASKSSGPELAIEADISKKNQKIDPDLLKHQKNQMAAGWYDQSRQKIGEAIVELEKESR